MHSYETGIMSPAETSEFVKQFDKQIGTERQVNDTGEGFCHVLCMEMATWEEHDTCHQIEKAVQDIEDKTTSEQIKVRACSIVCDNHPEWGTWGVMEDRGDYFDIRGQSGDRVLFKTEADQFWSVV